MDRTQIQEMLAYVANDPTLRLQFAAVMRAADSHHQAQRLDPRTHLVVADPVPSGYISYQQAHEQLGLSNAYVRMLVSRCHVPGGNGHVCRQALVDYVMAYSRRETREQVLAHMRAGVVHEHTVTTP